MPFMGFLCHFFIVCLTPSGDIRCLNGCKSTLNKVRSLTTTGKTSRSMSDGQSLVAAVQFQRSNPFPFLGTHHHNRTDQMYKPYQCNDKNYLKRNWIGHQSSYQFYFKFYFKALTFATTPFVIFWPMIIAFGWFSMEFVFKGCCYLFRFMTNSS